jgi:hypothetical protein
MVATLARVVAPAYAEMDFDELAAAPVEALTGLTPDDAAALRHALDIRTIGDLGRHPAMIAAVVIAALAGTGRPSPTGDPLLARLEQTRATIGRGRVFTTSTAELVREARAERDGRW